MWVAARIRQFANSLPRGEIFTTRQLLSFGTRGAVDQAVLTLVNQRYLERLARGVFRLYDDDNEEVPASTIAFHKARGFGKTLYSLGTIFEEAALDLERITEEQSELAEAPAIRGTHYAPGNVAFEDMLERDKIEWLRARISFSTKQDRLVQAIESEQALPGDEVPSSDLTPATEAPDTTWRAVQSQASLPLIEEGELPVDVFAVYGSSSSFRHKNGIVKFKGMGNRKLALGESRTGRLMRDLWVLGVHRVDVMLLEVSLLSLGREERIEIAKLNAFMPSWLTHCFIDNPKSLIAFRKRLDRELYNLSQTKPP